MKLIFVCLLFVFSFYVVAGSVDPSSIKKVHLVFSNHLDVGFADYALNIVNLYFDTYFPKAVNTSLEMRNQGSRYIYMTQSWLVSLYLDCPGKNFPVPKAGAYLHCPNDEDRNNFIAAVKRGDITWHAFPFNAEPEVLDKSMFQYGVSLSQDLSDAYGVPRPITLSQRDVPGMTGGVIDLLTSMGVSAISVGVNGGSAPPAVPRIFVWKPNFASNDIIGMWHPNGYGGTTINDAAMFEGFDEALLPAWKGDNAGPHSPSEAQDVYKQAKKEFPNAEIVASTFDNFITALLPIKSKLPVIDKEIGDTWIYGISSDPWKLAAFRAISRERLACLDSGACSANDTSFQNFNRLLLKVSEHTWGLDVKRHLDWTHWSNPSFHSVEFTQKGFIDIQDSWNEQRGYINHAVKALGDHPLVKKIDDALSQLKPSLPSTQGFTKETNMSKIFNCNRFDIRFSQTGAINYLYDTSTKTNWAGVNNPLAEFHYESHSQDDYDKFFSEYFYCPSCTWATLDFGKFNCSTGGAKHQDYVPSAASLWSKETTDTCSFLIEMNMPEESYTNFGAPKSLWLSVNVTKQAAVQKISLDLEWFDKTAARLPESLWLSFVPVSTSKTGWTMEKMSVTIDPLQVINNGSKHLHSISSGVSYYSQSEGTITFNSLDAPLLSFGAKNPFPTPLNVDPNPEEGVHFLLENQIWGTNYVMWYPFNEGKDTSSKFRFELPFYLCNEGENNCK